MKKILNIVFVSLLALSSFAVDYKPNNSLTKESKTSSADKNINNSNFELLAPEKGMVRRSYRYDNKISFENFTDQIISKKITPIELNIVTSGEFLADNGTQINMFTGSLQIKKSGYYVFVVQQNDREHYRLYINGKEVIPSTEDISTSIRVYLHAGFNEFKFLARFPFSSVKYVFTLREENSLKTFPIGPGNFYYESDPTGTGSTEVEAPFM